MIENRSRAQDKRSTEIETKQIESRSTVMDAKSKYMAQEAQ